jgi:hypothetical protein
MHGAFYTMARSTHHLRQLHPVILRLTFMCTFVIFTRSQMAMEESADV